MAPNVLSTHKISVTLRSQGGLSYVRETYVCTVFHIVSVSLLSVSSQDDIKFFDKSRSFKASVITAPLLTSHEPLPFDK